LNSEHAVGFAWRKQPRVFNLCLVLKLDYDVTASGTYLPLDAGACRRFAAERVQSFSAI
jgi:hypothetical protein